jgi:hypothetical protein
LQRNELLEPVAMTLARIHDARVVDEKPDDLERSCRLKAVLSELMEKAPGSVLCWGGVCSTAEVRAGIEYNLQLNFSTILPLL